MAGFMSNFSGSGYNDQQQSYSESSETYTSDNYGSNYGGGGGYSEQDRFSETQTYSSNNDDGPPQVPYPWRSCWSDRDNRYYFEHQETGETVWEYDEVVRRTRGGEGGGGYDEQQTTTTTTTTYYDDSSERMYDGYERDKYRVEEDVEEFPEEAANWSGRKVQEVEDVPQDVEYGFDRFGNRVEQRFDNAVYDVEDAPEEVANWAGRKVGDVERFDDNVDNSYDEGRYEGRYEGRNDGW